jgi:cytochrome c-type biogenesis protein CcmH
MRRIFNHSLLLVAIVALASAVTAEAQGSTPTDDEVNAIAKKLYCPVCPNTPLDVCETKACQDWRAQIRDELAAGWSEQQIIDYFVAQYGERVLAEPQRRGFTSFVWILPVIAAALGVVGVIGVVRRWRARPLSSGPPAGAAEPDLPEIDPETLTRIERELEKRA